jgi:hypothetical protein
MMPQKNSQRLFSESLDTNGTNFHEFPGGWRGGFASIRELGQPGRMVIRAAGQKNLLTIVTDGELSSDTLFAA